MCLGFVRPVGGRKVEGLRRIRTNNIIKVSKKSILTLQDLPAPDEVEPLKSSEEGS